MGKLLSLLLVLLPSLALGQDYNVAAGRPRTTGTQVRQFWASSHSEPSTTFAADPIQYTSCFADNRDWETAEGNIFDVIAATTQLCNLTVSMRGGTLDADDDAVVRVKLCDGGDVSSCVWSTLGQSGGGDYEVTISPDNTTSDVRWTNTACSVTLDPGDVVACEWDQSSGITDWAEGGLESPDLYIEALNTNNNEFFTVGTLVGSPAGNHFQSILGGSNIQEAADADNLSIPIPGTFTLVAGYVVLEADPSSAYNVHIAEGDGSGDDLGTDGGTALLTMQVPTTGASTHSDTSCTGDCSFTAGERVNAGSTGNDLTSGVTRAIGLRWTGTGGEWFGGGVIFDVATDVYFNSRGHTSTNMCPAGGGAPEDPHCMSQTPRSWTATAIYGYQNNDVEAGTFSIIPRETGVNGQLNCDLATNAGSPATCSETTNETFDADDWLSIYGQETSATTGGGSVGFSIKYNTGGP